MRDFNKAILILDAFAFDGSLTRQVVIIDGKNLKDKGLTRGRYNQIANYVIAQSEINIAIGDKSPEIYFAEIADQVNFGKVKYGGLVDRATLEENLTMNCLPLSMLNGNLPDYDEFLAERRKLMALRIKTWFEALS